MGRQPPSGCVNLLLGQMFTGNYIKPKEIGQRVGEGFIDSAPPPFDLPMDKRFLSYSGTDNTGMFTSVFRSMRMKPKGPFTRTISVPSRSNLH